jgi:branched-chain amino acid transport system permease protein
MVLTALSELLRPVGDARLVLYGLVILLGPWLVPQGLITPSLLEWIGCCAAAGGARAQPALW